MGQKKASRPFPLLERPLCHCQFLAILALLAPARAFLLRPCSQWYLPTSHPSSIRSSLRSSAPPTPPSDNDGPAPSLENGPASSPSPVPSSPPTPPPSPPTAKEYFFGTAGEFDEDLAYLGISRQRLLLNAGVATTLALGANFVGVTSALLNTFSTPETMSDWKLDVLYPVRGFKRFVDTEDGYEFRYPQSWLSDQAILLADTQARTATLSSPSSPSDRPPRAPPSSTRKVRPDAAFGPPGGNREENLSVIKSVVMPGFSLAETLGPPTAAAELLLSTAIAPPGSGKVANLVMAQEETRDGGGKTLERKVYVFEYLVGREGGRDGDRSHSLSVIAPREKESALFTLTVLAPERRWEDREKELREVASSFRLTR